MIGKASRHASVLSVAIIAGASMVGAQEYSYESGYVRYTEGSVSVQRAQSPEPEPAEVNLPVLAGDRVWTGGDGFAEIRFVDGTVIRLGASTKVDFMEFGAEPNIRLWSGSVAVDAGADSAPVRIDTPIGSVLPREAGTYRVDVLDGGNTSVSVARGVAELASETGSVLVATGQRSTLEPGSQPSEPAWLDTTQSDALDVWREARQPSAPVRRTVPLAELPREVQTYAEDLEGYGTWRADPTYGSVWYPSVGVGWAPYRNGRWCYTSFGYTWVAAEPWGWAPHHYGRWGYNTFGWYWVPGRYWSPAWVSVAVGSFWVGWSPLGYHGGPVFSYGHSFYGGGRYPRYEKRHPYYYGRYGKAVPRQVYDHGAGWNYSRKDGFGRRGRTRLRASDVRSSASSAYVHHQGAVFDRSLNPHALGRNNDLARRGPQVAPFSGSTGGRLGRAVERVGARDRGRVTGGSPSTRSAEPRSTRRNPPTRAFVPPGWSRNGERGQERGGTRATEPAQRSPSRTRVRSGNRIYGAENSQPHTRGQEFFDSSERRRAVTRSDRRDGGRSQEFRRTPPRSQSNANRSPRSTSRSGHGVQRSRTRGGGHSTPGMQGGSRGGNRGASRARGSGARRSRSGGGGHAGAGRVR